MKHPRLLALFLVSVALGAGCKPAPDKPAVQTDATTTEPLDKVGVATTDAAQGIRDYTYAQKAEFVAWMQDRMSGLNRSLDELSAKMESSSDAVKADARPKFAALREQMAKMKAQLSVVQNATESTWDGVKAETQKSYNALKDGFAQARQWVGEKIAP